VQCVRNRQRHRAIHASLLGLALSLLCACVGYYSGRGDSAAERGDWDAAFEAYLSAVQRAPEDEALKSKLEQARTEAARMHREAGLRARQERRPHDAVKELEASLAYLDDESTRVELEAALVERQRADAEKAVVDATIAEKERDLGTAREQYERARELNPELAPSVNGKLASVVERIERAEEIAQQAAKLLDQGDLEKARQRAEQALEIHVKEPTAITVRGEIKAEREASAFEREARNAETFSNYALAVDRARRAQATRATEKRSELVESLEQQAFRFYKREGDRAMDRKLWLDAVDAYGLARTYGPDPRALQQEIVQARYEIELDSGDFSLRQGDVAGALAHYEQAYAYRPSRSLERRIRELRASSAQTPR